MKRYLRTLAALVACLFFVVLEAPLLNAQIANEIRAHLNHSFVIGNTTLPPGEYTFQVLQDSQNSVMTATSENDKTSVSFVVGAAIDNHTACSFGTHFSEIWKY